MAEALRIHRNRAAFAAALAGKQVRPQAFKTPRDYPGIAARFQDVEFEKESQPRAASTAIKSVTPSGDCIARPATGFPRECFTLILTPPSSVSSSTPGRWRGSSELQPGSAAERAGFKPGDEIVELRWSAAVVDRGRTMGA